MIKTFEVKNLFSEESIKIDFHGKKNDESRYMIGPNGNGKTTILNLLFQTLVIQEDPRVNTSYRFNYTHVKLEKNEIFLKEVYLYKINSDSCLYIYQFDKKIVLIFMYENHHDDTQFQIFEEKNPEMKFSIKNFIEQLSYFMLKNDILDLLHYQISIDPCLENALDEEDFYKKYNYQAAGTLEEKFINITERFENENPYGFNEYTDIEKVKSYYKLDQLESSILYFPTYRQIGDIINNYQLDNRVNTIDWDDDLDFEKNRKVIHLNNENLELIFKKFKSYLENINSSGMTKLMKRFIEKSLTFDAGNQSISINSKSIEKVSKLVKELKINNHNINFDFDSITKKGVPLNSHALMNLAILSDLYTEFLEDLEIRQNPIKILQSSLKSFFKNKIELEFNDKTFEIELSKNLNQLSSGQKQLIGIVAFSLLEINKPIFKKPLILIDEPELSLHIDWQRKLNYYLSAFESNQYFVATHSPFFLKDIDTAFVLKVNN